MGRKPRSLSSCYECVGIKYCFNTGEPGLSREEAREKARLCNSFRKGRSTETVIVLGRENGMSRKRAEELVSSGQAVWVDRRVLVIK